MTLDQSLSEGLTVLLKGALVLLLDVQDYCKMVLKWLKSRICTENTISNLLGSLHIRLGNWNLFTDAEEKTAEQQDSILLFLTLCHLITKAWKYGTWSVKETPKFFMECTTTTPKKYLLVKIAWWEWTKTSSTTSHTWRLHVFIFASQTRKKPLSIKSHAWEVTITTVSIFFLSLS